MPEYRMFAAVAKTVRGKDYINPHTIRPQASQVRELLSDDFGMSWEEVKKLGWRVRPVVVSLAKVSSDD